MSSAMIFGEISDIHGLMVDERSVEALLGEHLRMGSADAQKRIEAGILGSEHRLLGRTGVPD
jgi:hypothetical protein